MTYSFVFFVFLPPKTIHFTTLTMLPMSQCRFLSCWLGSWPQKPWIRPKRADGLSKLDDTTILSKPTLARSCHCVPAKRFSFSLFRPVPAPSTVESLQVCTVHTLLVRPQDYWLNANPSSSPRKRRSANTIRVRFCRSHS